MFQEEYINLKISLEIGKDIIKYTPNIQFTLKDSYFSANEDFLKDVGNNLTIMNLPYNPLHFFIHFGYFESYKILLKELLKLQKENIKNTADKFLPIYEYLLKSRAGKRAAFSHIVHEDICHGNKFWPITIEAIKETYNLAKAHNINSVIEKIENIFRDGVRTPYYNTIKNSCVNKKSLNQSHFQEKKTYFTNSLYEQQKENLNPNNDIPMEMEDSNFEEVVRLLCQLKQLANNVSSHYINKISPEPLNEEKIPANFRTFTTRTFENINLDLSN
ncbi:MAG: hypothetical protein J0H68_00310 [Sphingobacteriia bacterium]|nr:hypothetical protein [Sphingobacteriia bacterium]